MFVIPTGVLFHGWWQLADNILRTVVALRGRIRRSPLTIPAHFFDQACVRVARSR